MKSESTSCSRGDRGRAKTIKTTSGVTSGKNHCWGDWWAGGYMVKSFLSIKWRLEREEASLSFGFWGDTWRKAGGEKFREKRGKLFWSVFTYSKLIILKGSSSCLPWVSFPLAALMEEVGAVLWESWPDSQHKDKCFSHKTNLYVENGMDNPDPSTFASVDCVTSHPCLQQPACFYISWSCVSEAWVGLRWFTVLSHVVLALVLSRRFCWISVIFIHGLGAVEGMANWTMVPKGTLFLELVSVHLHGKRDYRHAQVQDSGKRRSSCLP